MKPIHKPQISEHDIWLTNIQQMEVKTIHSRLMTVEANIVIPHILRVHHLSICIFDYFVVPRL